MASLRNLLSCPAEELPGPCAHPLINRTTYFLTYRPTYGPQTSTNFSPQIFNFQPQTKSSTTITNYTTWCNQKFMSETPQIRMCVTRYVCPSCPIIHSIFSIACPANLPHHQPPPLTHISHPDKMHPTHEWCEQVSALCDKCQEKRDGSVEVDERRETTEWRRRLKRFKQKKNGKADRGRVWGGEEDEGEK